MRGSGINEDHLQKQRKAGLPERFFTRKKDTDRQAGNSI
jgi:hypothetical protein